MKGMEIVARTEDLLFSIRRSVRYHNRRRRFYETWNSLTVTIAAVGGASAATAFSFGGTGWLKWVAPLVSSIIALSSALDLAIGTSRNGNTHAELARKFIGLEKRFSHGRDLEDKEYEEAVCARLEIEAGEPPILRLLDIMCHFELMLAEGSKKKIPKIPLMRRKAANWMSQQDYVQRFAENYNNSQS